MDVISVIRNQFDDEESVFHFLFLYSYMQENGRIHEFRTVLSDCCGMTSWCIQEVVKCVTHNMPYKPLIGATAECMTEIRRYMEDTGDSYLPIAEKLAAAIKHKNVLYEFRRFNKCDNPISLEQDEKLFDWVARNAGDNWMVIASMYEVYIREGFESMMKFADKWLERAVNNHMSEGGALWDMDIQVYMWCEASGSSRDYRGYY